MPKCSSCEKVYKGGKQKGQNQTLFICESCQDKINLPIWKTELDTMEKSGDPGYKERTKFLKKKIADLEK